MRRVLHVLELSMAIRSLSDQILLLDLVLVPLTHLKELPKKLHILEVCIRLRLIALDELLDLLEPLKHPHLLFDFVLAEALLMQRFVFVTSLQLVGEHIGSLN